MKYLILSSILVFAQMAFAGPCVNLKEAKANLKDAIYLSPDFGSLFNIWNLEVTMEEAYDFVSDLKFYAESNRYSNSKTYTYYIEDSGPLRATVMGKVNCDGTAELRVFGEE